MNRFIKENKTALTVAIIAFLVRLIYLIELANKPGFTVPMVDEKFHWLWAAEIIEKSFFGETAYFRAPLYGYFLAFMHFLTNGSIFYAKLLQMLLCGGTAFYIYKLAKHLFDNKTALTAGLIYAFYGTLIFYEAMFLIPVLFVFLLTLGLYRLIIHKDSDSVKTWLLTGFIFGLAAISRPNILLVMPFFALYFFMIAKNAKSIIQKFKVPLLLFFGVMMAIAPVTIRNYVVTGELILISSQGGVNLYLGNNKAANGLTMMMPEVELNESISWRQFETVTIKAAERESNKELTPTEASSFWTSKAISFIKENPGEFLGLLYKKTVYLLSGFENSDNADMYYHRNKSILYSLLLWDFGLKFPFGLLLPFFIVGVYLTRRKFKELQILYIYLLAYIPSIILFLVTARHRLPLIPVMIIIAAAGIIELVRIWKKNKSELAVPALLFLLPLFIFNFNYFDLGQSSDFQIHFNDGMKYEQLGDYAKAEEEYILAEEVFPYSASLINNLGFVQYRLGKFDESAASYERAIKNQSDFAPAYNNYGLLMQQVGNKDSAIVLFKKAIEYHDYENDEINDLGRVYGNIADIYEQQQILDSSFEYHFKAVSTNVTHWKVYSKAAAFYARYEQYELSDSLFIRARRLHDLDAGDLFNWGLSNIERKQYSFGLSKMFKAVKTDPTLYQAYYVIAVSYEQNEYPKDSIMKYIDLTLEYNPTFQPVLDLKNRVMKK